MYPHDGAKRLAKERVIKVIRGEEYKYYKKKQPHESF